MGGGGASGAAPRVHAWAPGLGSDVPEGSPGDRSPLLKGPRSVVRPRGHGPDVVRPRGEAKSGIIEDVAVFVAEVGQPPTARRYGMTYALALAAP